MSVCLLCDGDRVCLVVRSVYLYGYDVVCVCACVLANVMACSGLCSCGCTHDYVCNCFGCARRACAGLCILAGSLGLLIAHGTVCVLVCMCGYRLLVACVSDVCVCVHVSLAVFNLGVCAPLPLRLYALAYECLCVLVCVWLCDRVC